MAAERREAPLSPVIEHLLEQHEREVAALRERFGNADPAELLASFVRDAFPLEALISARGTFGKGNDPDDGLDAEVTERDRDEW